MNRMIAPLLFALACAPLATLAQTAPAAAQSNFPAWEQLTPAQRELLIAPVRERWNNEPHHRERFMDYAKRWKSLPPDKRDDARRGVQRWENMTPQQRDEARAVFHATRQMDKSARRAFMEQWQKMSPQQRTEWAKAHPAPERRERD
jgi:hypothetical protein